MSERRLTYSFGPLERRGLLGPVRAGQVHDFLHEFVQRNVRKIQFHGPREIQERFHHPVQPQDLAGEEIAKCLQAGDFSRGRGLISPRHTLEDEKLLG